MRAIAPGGGASVTRCTMPTACPASASSSTSRGAWSLASTSRARSPTQCSTPSIEPLRASGREHGLAPAELVAAGQALRRERHPLGHARLGLPGELEGPRAVQAALPVTRREIRRRPVPGQVARLDHLRVPLVGLAPQEVGRVGEVAGLVEDEEGRRIEVVEAGVRGDEAGPDLGGVPGVEGATLGDLRAGRRVAAEAGEILREALGQARRGPAEARPDLLGPADRQQELRRGQEDDLANGLDAALVGGIEGAHGVDLVTEQLDADGQRRGRREDVDDAATARELARGPPPR